ncbi:MAG: hypothetical protein WCO54_00260 [Bacteroidota bacterium]
MFGVKFIGNKNVFIIKLINNFVITFDNISAVLHIRRGSTCLDSGKDAKCSTLNTSFMQYFSAGISD